MDGSSQLAMESSSEGRLAELYARYAPTAVRMAFLLTGDQSQAEDLVHEAFVRCIGRFGHLRAHEAFDAYLRRTVVNLHTSRLRRRRTERAWLARHGAWEAVRVISMPDVGAREDLWQALRELPARQRAALVLRYYEDLSERDTAAALGCSVAAVKSLVQRGGHTLRTIVGEDG